MQIIGHWLQDFATLTRMTAMRASGLQFFRDSRSGGGFEESLLGLRGRARAGLPIQLCCNLSATLRVITLKPMKLKLIALTALGVLALGNAALANDPQDASNDRGGGRGFRHDPLARMTDNLNLTPDQKAKIQPILDQARPQIEQIHREAMEKMKSVFENTKSQIRPLLTPEQQKKLDEARGNHMARRHHRGDGQDDGGDDQ
jgi:Spy/CpxP family protein refolding chaperone